MRPQIRKRHRTPSGEHRQVHPLVLRLPGPHARHAPTSSAPEAGQLRGRARHVSLGNFRPGAGVQRGPGPVGSEHRAPVLPRDLQSGRHLPVQQRLWLRDLSGAGRSPELCFEAVQAERPVRWCRGRCSGQWRPPEIHDRPLAPPKADRALSGSHGGWPQLSPSLAQPTASRGLRQGKRQNRPPDGVQWELQRNFPRGISNEHFPENHHSR